MKIVQKSSGTAFALNTWTLTKVRERKLEVAKTRQYGLLKKV